MKTILETDRLFLREFRPEDAIHFFNLNSNPNVIRFTGDVAFKNVSDAQFFLENYADYRLHGYGRLAVIEKSTQHFLGWCGLKFHPESSETDLGFRFFEEYWNHGFATECAKACMKFGFEELHLKKIIGRAMKENTASINVLEKMGMSFSKNFDFNGHEGVIYEAFRKR